MINRILNTFIVKIITAVLSFLIAVVISQYLGADGKGEQGIIITTIALIILVCNIFGGAALTYMVPRSETSLILLPSYLWIIFTNTVFYFLMKVLNFTEVKYILDIAIISAISSAASVHQNIILAKEKIKQYNFLLFLQTFMVIASLLVFFVIFNKRDIASYINSLYISFIISLILSSIFISGIFKKFRLHSFSEYSPVIKELFRYGFLNQFAYLLQVLSFRISYYLLDYYSGESMVGIYSNGAAIIESIWMISASITVVQFAKIVNTNDKKYSQELTLKLSRMAFTAAFFALIPMLLLPESFYSFVFGKEFGDIRLVMLSLAPGILIFNYHLVISHYFSGTGKYFINAIVTFTGLIINVLLSVFLIKYWGIVGAGIAASISYAFCSVLIAIFFTRESKAKVSELIPTFHDLKNYFDYLMGVLKNKRIP